MFGAGRSRRQSDRLLTASHTRTMGLPPCRQNSPYLRGLRPEWSVNKTRKDDNAKPGNRQNKWCLGGPTLNPLICHLCSRAEPPRFEDFGDYKYPPPVYSTSPATSLRGS